MLVGTLPSYSEAPSRIICGRFYFIVGLASADRQLWQVRGSDAILITHFV